MTTKKPLYSEPSEKTHGSKGHRVSRRTFLAAGAAAPTIVPSFVVRRSEDPTPSDKLRIAAVGVGGMGQNYLGGCRREEIVALCDLDHKLAGKVFERYPRAKQYHDYRKMFDKEANNFDALIVATPDHTHAVILMAAIELNKHVYCAKPITHTVGEARKIRRAFLDAKHLITKSSLQFCGTGASRSVTELLNTGVIGPIHELHIWHGKQPTYPCSLVRPTDTPPPPPGMDWDLWIGPAPYRPFHSAYHPFRWRSWWDFGAGAVGDVAIHTVHMFFKELQLEAPTAVYGSHSVHRKGWKLLDTTESQSDANMITWQYPERGSLPPLDVHWYDGGVRPHRPRELDNSIDLPLNGVLFVGEKGKLIADFFGGNSYRRRRGLPGGLLLPEKEFRDFEQPEETMYRCDAHYSEWVSGCKTGTKTVCPIEYGCEMTEMGLLGALALQSEGVLEWDAKAMRITNNPDADRLVDPPYRDGWTL